MNEQELECLQERIPVLEASIETYREWIRHYQQVLSATQLELHNAKLRRNYLLTQIEAQSD